MSKRIYVCPDGILHNVPTLYVPVRGVNRKVKKGYVVVDGVHRQFYGSGYQWNRYSVISTTKYVNSISTTEALAYSNSSMTTSSTDVYYPAGTYYDMSFNEDTGTYTYTNKMSNDKVPGYPEEGTITAYGSNTTMYGSPLNSGDWKITRYVRTTTGSYYGLKLYGYKMTPTESVTYTKGDKIDTVVSDSPSEYPKDGIQGDYWYVFIGKR